MIFCLRGRCIDPSPARRGPRWSEWSEFPSTIVLARCLLHRGHAPGEDDALEHDLLDTHGLQPHCPAAIETRMMREFPNR